MNQLDGIVYNEKFQPHFEVSPGMNKKGVQRYLEALSNVPAGHEFFGTWPNDKHDYGNAGREDVVILDCPVYDVFGELIEDYVYLASRKAESQAP